MSFRVPIFCCQPFAGLALSFAFCLAVPSHAWLQASDPSRTCDIVAGEDMRYWLDVPDAWTATGGLFRGRDPKWLGGSNRRFGRGTGHYGYMECIGMGQRLGLMISIHVWASTYLHKLLSTSI